MPRTTLLAVIASMGLAAFAGSAAAQPRPPSAQLRPPSIVCQPITDQQVAGLFDLWDKALLTGDPDAVVSRYTADATLLPTVQNGPLEGHAAIRDYFVYFLKQKPLGHIDQRVIRLGCNVAWDIGLYTFTVNGDQPGTRKQVHARYTFVYVPQRGGWLIAHHHSSALPVPGK
jgi:uncharacterized protein (TIGR02246 family)